MEPRNDLPNEVNKDSVIDAIDVAHIADTTLWQKEWSGRMAADSQCHQVFTTEQIHNMATATVAALGLDVLITEGASRGEIREDYDGESGGLFIPPNARLLYRSVFFGTEAEVELRPFYITPVNDIERAIGKSVYPEYGIWVLPYSFVQKTCGSNVAGAIGYALAKVIELRAISTVRVLVPSGDTSTSNCLPI